MPTPAPSAPSVSSFSGSYPGLAEYMGLELTEAEVRANMPEYLPAVPQVHSNRYRNLFPLKLSIASIFPLNRAAALPLSLGLALLPPFRVWALAWQKHRWRITKNILKKSKSMLEVNHGVRQVVLCKDGDGKIGLRVKAVNKGSTRFGSRLLSLVSCRCVCLSCHQGLSSCPWRPQVWRPTPPGGRRQPGWILIWQGALLSVYI